MVSENDVDLDDEKKTEILSLEARLKTANYFELLGVHRDASPDEVRKAFHDASRKFHPDRYFGKQLGPFKAKLETIFRHLVIAHQTLSSPERRSEYLSANPHLGRSPSGIFPDEPDSPARHDREAERRSRLGRHPYMAAAKRVSDLMSLAKQAIDKGEFSQAFSHLTAASQVAPQNTEVKSLLADVRKKADDARAESSFQRGIEALARGDDDLALEALRSAATAKPTHAVAHYKLAILLERRRADAREIISWAQKAVDASPRDIDARILLGRTFLQAGMKALAELHFEEAKKLDPNHPELKKYLKKRWPF